MTDQLTIPMPVKTWFVEVAEDWAVTAKHTHRTGPWIEYWWPTRNYLASGGRAVLGEPTRVGPFTEADATEYREHLISGPASGQSQDPRRRPVMTGQLPVPATSPARSEHECHEETNHG